MFQVWQIALITLYAFIQPNETAGFKIGMNSPILAGWFTGLVLGNPAEGLFLGGTLQLMTLGVATYGGMSIPNTVVGAIVGTALSMSMDTELALGIAITVASFMIQLDVLRRYICIFLSNRADALIEKKRYASAARMNLGGIIVKGLSCAIPVFLVLAMGSEIAETLVNLIPAWVLTALGVSGKCMPVVGIVILLRYLPAKRYWVFLLAGYLLSAYLGLSITGLALFGIVFAVLDFGITQKIQSAKPAAAMEGVEIDE